jgi:UDP-N-acetylglucosamine acyltransferase
VVNPGVSIAGDATIGPFCVIEPDVVIGEGCVLESMVVVKSGTTLGANNHVYEGAVLGGPPQHVHMPAHPGRVTIGSGNTIREFVTIHRALEEDKSTIIGDNNLLMANVHVAHDCRIGDNVILTNNAMLAGHVRVEDRAYLSAVVGVHQFCRVGALAMIGGHARVTKDVPPFVTIDGHSSLVVGLNVVGLRRARYSSPDIQQIKDAYRLIYRSGLLWSEMIKQLQAEFSAGPAARFHAFLSATTRGIVAERRLPPGATIKLHRDDDDSSELRSAVG